MTSARTKQRPAKARERDAVARDAVATPTSIAPLEVGIRRPARAGKRLGVAKAYKMFVGGAFVRSESGRSFPFAAPTLVGADAAHVNVPLGSRKDVRDAVLAAKNAGEGWAKRTAFNRSQILYRLAEVMEARRGELEFALVRAGLRTADASLEVDTAIDRCVHYAGFADKFQSLLASSNPVSGPHFAFTVPEPMGVVGVVAPPRPALLALVSLVVPAICAANTVVALVSEDDPLTPLVWAECLATSDLPGGVVNLLSGRAAEMAPHLAKHREVSALSFSTPDRKLAIDLERSAADSVKRVRGHRPDLDWSSAEGLGFVEALVEMKSIWHPVGL